jgi:hypothetical protein
MTLRKLILLTVLALPAALPGQRGAPGFAELRKGDLEQLNPARLVVDTFKGLPMDRAQFARLDSIRKRFDADASQYAKQVSRLQRQVLARGPLVGRRRSAERPATAKDSVERAKKDSIEQAKLDKHEEEVSAARRTLGETMLTIRAAYDSTLVRTRAILTAEQLQRVDPLLESASNELTIRLRQANVR